jgi:hypothetical protein
MPWPDGLATIGVALDHADHRMLSFIVAPIAATRLPKSPDRLGNRSPDSLAITIRSAQQISLRLTPDLI